MDAFFPFAFHEDKEDQENQDEEEEEDEEEEDEEDDEDDGDEVIEKLFEFIGEDSTSVEQHLTMALEVNAINLQSISAILGTHINSTCLLDEKNRIISSVRIGSTDFDTTAGCAHLLRPIDRAVLIFIAKRACFSGSAEIDLIARVSEFSQRVKEQMALNREFEQRQLALQASSSGW